MTPRRTPAVATWLLQRFSFGRQNDPLTGDLIEEYRNGRSRAWYWKQALLSIALTFRQEILTHRLLAVRAIATGWASWNLTIWFLYWLRFYKFESGLALKFPLAFKFGVYSGFALWIVGFSVWAVSGWAVARTHRQHQAGMVLAFALSVFLWKLQVLPWIFALIADSYGNPRYFPYIVTHLAALLPPASILLGGLWNLHPTDNLSEKDEKVAAQN